MNYSFIAIAEHEIPVAAGAVFQHAIDTYVSETDKVISAWRSFR